MKKFNLYSILFILSFFLFTCDDEGSEDVKEKDKFTTINDKTFWYSEGNYGYESWYIEKDNIYMYASEKEDQNSTNEEEWCLKIPIKDGQFKDDYGYEYLLNVLVNKEDTLTLQFVELPTSGDEVYWSAGEMDFVVRGNLLKVTMHYLEENGSFDTEEWGSYTKTDNDQKPTTTCAGG